MAWVGKRPVNMLQSARHVASTSRLLTLPMLPTESYWSTQKWQTRARCFRPHTVKYRDPQKREKLPVPSADGEATTSCNARIPMRIYAADPLHVSVCYWPCVVIVGFSQEAATEPVTDRVHPPGWGALAGCFRACSADCALQLRTPRRWGGGASRVGGGASGPGGGVTRSRAGARA